MKTLKYLLLILISGLLITACEISEDPKFPREEELFETDEGARTVLLGSYSSFLDFNYYGADFFHLTLMTSGLHNTMKKAHYTDILPLTQTPNHNYVEAVWKGMYQSIGRANDFIIKMERSALLDSVGHHPDLGSAHFTRAVSYFNLVRLYGGVPLVLESISKDYINLPRSSADDVYTQIIADLEKATMMMQEQSTDGLPTKYAAHMLLAKVYMQLAGNQRAADTDLWQKAYDEAIQVYGEFSLVSDYSALWQEATSNNTSESLFEIQGNEQNTLRLYQLFTPSKGNKGGSTWGRIRPNVECYDQHVARYPGDPRIDQTFLSEWHKYNDDGSFDKMVQAYPNNNNRKAKERAYPSLYKYYIKDHTRLNYNTIMNYVVLRYADLLLMLSEIENELNGPADAYQYVNEVLGRARGNGAVPADWSGLDQDQFREAIMAEYRFELYGEGHEWFNDRRRGYEWFKSHVIEPHNNLAEYDFTEEHDVLILDNPRNILMPIPLSEITANPNITNADQNPGY